MEGLTWVPCENHARIEKLMEQGTKTRTTASTNLNAGSSRSHLLTAIQFRQVRARHRPGPGPSWPGAGEPSGIFRLDLQVKVAASNHRRQGQNQDGEAPALPAERAHRLRTWSAPARPPSAHSTLRLCPLQQTPHSEEWLWIQVARGVNCETLRVAPFIVGTGSVQVHRVQREEQRPEPPARP